MGGEDKEKNAAKVSGKRDHVQYGLDTSMSRLLQDFTSAELLSNTPEAYKGANSYPDSDCETVVTSLRHLHIRRPAITKQKKNKTWVLKKKQPTNILNLAVAACGYHRPIVWPARLSGQNEKNQCNILRPSRLPVKKKGISGHEPKPSTNISASDAKKPSQVQHNVIFGNASSVDYSKLSFSGLCEQGAQNSKEGDSTELEQVYGLIPSHEAKGDHAKTLSKRHSTSGVPPAKIARTLVGNGESDSSETALLCYRNPASVVSRFSGFDFSHNQPLVTDRTRQTPNATMCTNHTVTEAASSPSSLETLATLRSALTSYGQSESSLDNVNYLSSPEPRLEETNVNELASYFEDLLHIPRKMSTMAEMMYA